MENKKITFDMLPEAVAYLIKEVAELKTLVEREPKHLPEKRLPIGIDEASKILHKAKSTIYALVRKGEVPCYKRGKKLFFYEDELLEWINEGRRKTSAEIKEEIQAEISNILTSD